MRYIKHYVKNKYFANIKEAGGLLCGIIYAIDFLL